MELAVSKQLEKRNAVTGEFLTIDGERYYAIHNADRMAPFFISVISSADHWLFASSTGGLTAGRVSPESALFPYVPVDKIHESSPHTGCKTIFGVGSASGRRVWEPFNREHDRLYDVSRHLYKNTLGNKLCFEEVNHDLGLAFRYTWLTSADYGFVRRCELQNLGDRPLRADVLDGLRNILPAGTPQGSQAVASNLVDAYKWTELDVPTGLGVYTLYSGISDRAEPSESLKANTVFCLGMVPEAVLLSSRQLDAFRAGADIHIESRRRGIRGAYFVTAKLEIAPGGSQQWCIVADVEQSQTAVVSLRKQLEQTADLANRISASVDRGSDELARIMAAADGFQVAAEEIVTVHHYANVLFNVLRGGTFDDEYRVTAQDLKSSIRHFNRDVHSRNEAFLDTLPRAIDFRDLISAVAEHGDPQLERLCYEYLPITFGRRHGDPSRPWNRFAIRLKDEYGNRRLSYEGNWRDIFQNWEALLVSYPGFAESAIAKFVNASTAEGYNPYRITNQGIDWEVEDPDDPWSYIGYWGDHQIIYLLKLLELSRQFHPTRLAQLLREPIFSYANVPYRIRPLRQLLDNPKNTVDYDHDLAERIENRVARIGMDGKLIVDTNGEVYRAPLLEKLLVPLLCKLGNFVIDGGIWLNTQRPEWNDANNALVGNGMSTVTLYYLRRYVGFLQELLAAESDAVEIAVEVSDWLSATASALASVRPLLASGPVGPALRFELLQELGQASSDFRERVYRQEGFSGKRSLPVDDVRRMLGDALAAIDHSIGANLREDGLYNAYNVLDLGAGELGIDTLYPMLEGQVAALSSGAIGAEQACDLLDALFESDIYRADQQSFMLYPDRELPGYFDKNLIPREDVESNAILQRMLSAHDNRIVSRDADGNYRFSSDFTNAGDLEARLDALEPVYGDELEPGRAKILDLYEKVFRHRAFTGRSGGMFGFEGLGCIYWHMVSKLLLAVQECFFSAVAGGTDKRVCDRLAGFYYRVREGLGFNKTPSDYGAFPMDPYSHTPRHAGARQPGMTGQVKEEILSRFGELGVRVVDGTVRFEPALLRAREFADEPRRFRYLDVDKEWRDIEVPARGLAFTWCQVPIVYRLDDDAEPSLAVTWRDGRGDVMPTASLPEQASFELFSRSGTIRQITLALTPSALFKP